MNKRMLAAAALALMLAGGLAMAQTPDAPPPAATQDAPPARADEGHHGWMRGRMMRMHMREPISKAAHFRLRKGDAVIDIKCADDEPTKACTDSAAALLAALPK